MSKTETQSEAQRLAGLLDDNRAAFGDSRERAKALAAAELRRLDAENQALRAAVAGTVPVVLGKKLFSFHCHQDWVNRAQRAWKMAGVRSEHTICLDQKGRVLLKGLEFRRADEEGAFPVDVYLALVDDTAAHDAWLAAENGGAA